MKSKIIKDAFISFLGFEQKASQELINIEEDMDNKSMYTLTKPPYIPFLRDAHLIDDITPKQFGERKLNNKKKKK